MKKKLAIISMIVILLVCFAGCSEKAKTTALQLEDNGDGTLNALDLETSPLDGGLNITVDKAQGVVNFQITDKSGNDTVEFFQFNPSSAICHRYKYVSMMGTGFNYYYDYNSDELVKIEDMENADVTESTKSSGRFEGAQSETKEMVDKLVTYFSESFGMSIEEAVASDK